MSRRLVGNKKVVGNKKAPHGAGLFFVGVGCVQEMQRPGTIRRASGPTRELSGASQPSR